MKPLISKPIFEKDSLNSILKTVLLISQSTILSIASLSVVHARGEVTQITTEVEPSTPYSYTKNSEQYEWGYGSRNKIVSFQYQGYTYNYTNWADKVIVRRVDNPNSSGNRCTLFAEKSNLPGYYYEADYPDDGNNTGNCDMSKVMGGRSINIGALNVFANTSSTAKNIERVDFIFTLGLTSPADNLLVNAGHVIPEKSGNNPVKIAAILSLDGSGNPASYGTLVLVNSHIHGDSTHIRYGITSTNFSFAFLANEAHAPQTQLTYLEATVEPLGMAFVTLEDLGVPANSSYYGFSYFGSDTDESVHTLTDPSSFPLDTPNAGVTSPGDADVYGGVAGYFVCSAIDCTPTPPVPPAPPLSFGENGRFNVREVNELK